MVLLKFGRPLRPLWPSCCAIAIARAMRSASGPSDLAGHRADCIRAPAANGPAPAPDPGSAGVNVTRPQALETEPPTHRKEPERHDLRNSCVKTPVDLPRNLGGPALRRCTGPPARRHPVAPTAEVEPELHGREGQPPHGVLQGLLRPLLRKSRCGRRRGGGWQTLPNLPSLSGYVRFTAGCARLYPAPTWSGEVTAKAAHGVGALRRWSPDPDAGLGPASGAARPRADLVHNWVESQW